jgi:hypothetical protein
MRALDPDAFIHAGDQIYADGVIRPLRAVEGSLPGLPPLLGVRGRADPCRHLRRVPDRSDLRSDYEHAKLDASDLQRSRELFKVLVRMPQEGAVWLSYFALVKAVPDTDWIIRFPLIWIGLESLFGPEGGAEIRFRLSQRIGLFLEDEPSAEFELFKRTRKDYDLGSKAVHGLRLSKTGEEELLEALSRAEDTLRRALAKILLDPGLLSRFSGVAREEFLDSLAFRSRLNP